MAQRVECPGCGRILAVPAGGRTASFTCPHCLTAVPASAEPIPVATAVQTAPTGVTRTPGEELKTCRHCGRLLEDDWRCCPSCGRPRHAEALTSHRGDLDVDVRRDQHRTSGCLVVLAVIGVLGILYFIGLAMNWGPGGGSAWATLLTSLVVLAGISAARVYSRPQPPTGGRGIRRVLFGTLALAGGVIASLALLCLAIGLFLFVVCLANPPRFH